MVADHVFFILLCFALLSNVLFIKLPACVTPFSMFHMMQVTLNSGSKAWLIKVDVSAAFDRVDLLCVLDPD